ncbi:hypothetical protein CP985_10945 [Malaciobacter mytili LMG 24559]|uniref:Uncharacterized protein n=1 Tax=Malaciobacter mytili LMG 24559 TaxID=1032238 RepID=A0AAX2AEH5_9BACT|nr:hypothetical protein [Malaciobacter mytili]AXH16314.1 hypothetical protein AMYT_a0014 [Malaciobacter mytili LMG 24559]RXK14980.1 hypothetical protein CP985_10945 [Malaciobacter mytili LMG 24559]
MQKDKLSKLTTKDRVLYDGMLREVIKRGSKPFLYIDNQLISINDISDKIEYIELYEPKIYYDGSKGYLEKYILNSKDELVLLEISGQETQIKAISSLVLLGKKNKKNELSIDEIKRVDFFQNGYRRKIQTLEDGISNCLIYHSNSISGKEQNIIFGKTEDEVYTRFLSWLKDSVPYPTHKDYNKTLFEELKNNKHLVEMRSRNLIAFEISVELISDEYKLFKEIVINLLKKLNVLEDKIEQKQKTTNKEKINYPKSTYLTEKQVKNIYKKLETLPNIYEYDGVKYKPVGIKLFSPNMTYYVVEVNKNGDEWFEPYERCFGYVKNESNPSLSEWGYFSIPELLEVQIPVRFINNSGPTNFHVGFEMDLYFEDKYIDIRGKIYNKDEIA